MIYEGDNYSDAGGDGGLKVTTEGGGARLLLIAIGIGIAYITYIMCTGMLKIARSGEWTELIQPVLSLVVVWALGRHMFQMFPRIQTFVRALKASSEGLQVNLLIHDLYLNRERHEDRLYPWSAVGDVLLQGLNSIEGADLGMYSVLIRLSDAEDVGGCLIIRYSRSQTPDAESRAQQCFEAVARCGPDLPTVGH